MTLDSELAVVATDALAFPLERDVLAVAGPDAQTFLQGQLAQDVDPLTSGQSAWSLLLQPAGKLDALLRVSRLADEQWILDVAAGWGNHVAERLNRFKLRVAADITPLEWTGLAVRGAAHTVLEGVATIVEAVAWEGVGGFDLLGESVTPPPGIASGSAETLEYLRIAAGVPAMGAELDDKTIPAEAGLTDSAVSFTKGCFVGQELVARIDSRGGNVPRRLNQLVVDGPVGPGAVAVQGEDPVGVVTSSAWSPLRGEAVALAYLRRSFDPDQPLAISSADRTARVVSRREVGRMAQDG